MAFLRQQDRVSMADDAEGSRQWPHDLWLLSPLAARGELGVGHGCATPAGMPEPRASPRAFRPTRSGFKTLTYLARSVMNVSSGALVLMLRGAFTIVFAALSAFCNRTSSDGVRSRRGIS